LTVGCTHPDPEARMRYECIHMIILMIIYECIHNTHVIILVLRMVI